MCKSRTMKRDDVIKMIARERLNIHTLETRLSDSLDFHDVSVWSVKEALEMAFDIGKRHAELSHENR